MLVIGDVCINVDRLEMLLGPKAPGYAPFLADSASAASCGSTIMVEVLDDPSPPNGSAVRFDTQGALSVQVDADGYRLGFYRRGMKQPHTTVFCNRDTTQAKVYLGDRLRQEGSTWSPPRARIATLVLRTVLMNHLAGRGGLLLHAAGGVIEGRGLVFCGVSTAGKSTLMRSFLDAGFGGSLLSDDRLVLRMAARAGKQPAAAEVWGTPWTSSAQVARNAHAPLGAVLFLVKADTCRLAPISPAQAMRRLVPTVSYPWYDQERAATVLDDCTRLVESSPRYGLHFKPGEDVVELLTGQTWGDETDPKPGEDA